MEESNIYNLEELLDGCYQLPYELTFLGKENQESSLEQEELSNMLIGLGELYRMKFERIKDVFYEIGSAEKERHQKMVESYNEYLELGRILKDDKY